MNEKICVFCSKSFLTKFSVKKYCSTECKDKQYYISNTEKIKQYYQDNRQEKIIKQSTYQCNNENYKQYKKDYYEKNKDAHSLYSKEYHKKNAKRVNERVSNYRKENTEKVRASKARWRKEHPNARRDRIKNASRLLTEDMKKDIYEIYKNRPKGYHVDHIVPLKSDVVSGLHVPWNLQYLTAKENLKKGNKVEN